METKIQARLSQDFWRRVCKCPLREQYGGRLWWPEVIMEDLQLGQWWRLKEQNNVKKKIKP